MALGLGLGIPYGTTSGPGFPIAGSTLDVDFVNNRANPDPTIASVLSVTRASVGYAEDTSGVWTSFSNNVLRRTNKGLLVEESRVNSLRNNSMQGAVVGDVGSTGSIPTNWTAPAIGGLTRQVTEIGTINGIDYIKLRIFGTTSGTVTGASLVNLESNTQVAAVSGQLWTGSVFLQLVAGSISNLTSFSLRMSERDSGGVQVTNSDTSLTTIDGTIQRFNRNRTLNNAATAFINCLIVMSAPISTNIDFTILIGWPQLELGNFMTSPIRTTSAAVTRSADNVSVNNPTTYFNLTNSSMYAEWLEAIGGATANTRELLNARVDANNFVEMRLSSANGRPIVQQQSAGATEAQLTATVTPTVGQVYKMASRFKLDDVLMRCTPALTGNLADTTAAVPVGTLATISVGSAIGLNSFNGYLRRICLFSSGQSDAALTAMVA